MFARSSCGEPVVEPRVGGRQLGGGPVVVCCRRRVGCVETRLEGLDEPAVVRREAGSL